MKTDNQNYKTIWVKKNNSKIIQIINQTKLPYKLQIENLKNSDDVIRAIKNMHVRGAGLIGATAGYGMYLASLEAPKENFNFYLIQTGKKLKSTRPTAVNLAYAVDKQLEQITKLNSVEDKINILFETANQIAYEDAENCRKIGECGAKLIREKSKEKKGERVNILTHCNAGRLAFVEYGSALSPIYFVFKEKIPVHIWVDITSPWNQGGKLTAWELEQEGISYSIISDNTGGLLMQKGLVDLVIVGADRVTRKGDIANKIGTYQKALAAKDNNVPFYVAFPSSTFDWDINYGREIQIEERNSDEIKYISGLNKHGKIEKILLTPKKSRALNYAFDITPSRLITGFITEKGICKPNERDILRLFPEYKK